MKYILVTGGVISGVGKGIIASSIGTLLKSHQLEVTSIKIDPYINIDAGTFSPYEHGEVFVLNDGSEVDLDLGNYERFLDTNLRSYNNITTGKIYEHVIKKERKGEYLGKTVQVIPHITDCIQEWVVKVAHTPASENGKLPDVCIIELGGTVGDIEVMPFMEAFRQFKFRVKKENFLLFHVSLVPQPKSTGEHKTKPTQSSVRKLQSSGPSPDIIICRSETPISTLVKEKIANFCQVSLEEVISIHDVSSIYRVPILLKSQGVLQLCRSKLHLNNIFDNSPNSEFVKWKELATRVEELSEQVRIAIVGKYTKLEDAYTSVSRALEHAAITVGYKVQLQYIDAENLEQSTLTKNPVAYFEAHTKLTNCDAVVVPGGFGKRGSEGKIVACKWCRERNIPFLGICFGLQVAVMEFARNVMAIKDADSSEFWEEKEIGNLSGNSEFPGNFVIVDMPEHTNCEKGGTMRCGLKEVFFRPEYKNDSILFTLYNKQSVIHERHRHRYEVNPSYVQAFEDNGLRFVGTDEESRRMEMFELINHPYYVATQFHCEYLSRPLRPAPPFLGLLLAACKKLDQHLKMVR